MAVAKEISVDAAKAAALAALDSIFPLEGEQKNSTQNFSQRTTCSYFTPNRLWVSHWRQISLLTRIGTLELAEQAVTNLTVPLECDRQKVAQSPSKFSLPLINDFIGKEHMDSVFYRMK